MVGNRTAIEGVQLPAAGLGQGVLGQLPQTAVAPKIGVDDGGADFGQGGLFLGKKQGHMSGQLTLGRDCHQRLEAAVGVEGDEPFGIVQVLIRIGIPVGPVEEPDYRLGIRRGEGPQGKGLGFSGERAGRRGQRVRPGKPLSPGWPGPLKVFD